jgi:hypothetical protein
LFCISIFLERIWQVEVLRKTENVSKADLKRAADIARTQNVTVEIEIDGRVFRISPIISGGPSLGPVAPSGGVVL